MLYGNIILTLQAKSQPIFAKSQHLLLKSQQVLLKYEVYQPGEIGRLCSQGTTHHSF